MKSTNIPEVKLGIVAVSRDCFPIQLSEKRRAAIVAACQAKGLDLYEAKTTVENEKDMEKAVAEVTEAGCNALTVFLGNFGPETPETLIAKFFNGPCMFVAAAEGDGDMINGRGDAYCGMLNCSYNLGMRHLKGYIPEYPVGTAEEIADKIAEFVPIARTILGVRDLKIITFGPRPQDFFACNAPIKGLYELGVEIEENSEPDLPVSYKALAGDGTEVENGRTAVSKIFDCLDCKFEAIAVVPKEYYGTLHMQNRLELEALIAQQTALFEKEVEIDGVPCLIIYSQK